jgi:O-methyltransferase
MVGHLRLANVRSCIERVIEDGVPGDLLEAGVWRGGVGIYMCAVLAARGDTERLVWLADSFRGLPKPDVDRYPADEGDRHWTMDELAIPVEQVKANFERFGLLDERVRFLEGWFSDTLPTAPVERLAVLRLDGDMYESTMDTLVPLEPKVSSGGFVIVDDYGAVPACKQAVDDYRAEHGITAPIERIDWTGAYWRKP